MDWSAFHEETVILKHLEAMCTTRDALFSKIAFSRRVGKSIFRKQKPRQRTADAVQKTPRLWETRPGTFSLFPVFEPAIWSNFMRRNQLGSPIWMARQVLSLDLDRVTARKSRVSPTCDQGRDRSDRPSAAGLHY